MNLGDDRVVASARPDVLREEHIVLGGGRVLPGACDIDAHMLVTELDDGDVGALDNEGGQGGDAGVGGDEVHGVWCFRVWVFAGPFLLPTSINIQLPK